MKFFGTPEPSKDGTVLTNYWRRKFFWPRSEPGFDYCIEFLNFFADVSTILNEGRKIACLQRLQAVLRGRPQRGFVMQFIAGSLV
ncbi:hypothetical protein AXW67_02305 [Bradyrhizobium neotropicale]|uniref:Uncharacterized protein n=1 Tax=Bradyrhizobium neotropicale TaxID=1497615 RepID=A0A176ZEB2_9BRAD|nr:hypothetical protein AXW67_02305 [Bradyrhizobium neotropicale]